MAERSLVGVFVGLISPYLCLTNHSSNQASQALTASRDFRSCSSDLSEQIRQASTTILAEKPNALDT